MAALGKTFFWCLLVLQLALDSECTTSLAGGKETSDDSRESQEDDGSALRRMLQISEESNEEDDTFPLLRDEATDQQARVLAVASSTGQNHVIRELLQDGVDPDLMTSVGTPPLWRAAFNDHFSTVELLLDAGASIDAMNSNGTTALYAAAQNGNQAIVEVLISRGADLDSRAKWGSSPLLVAAQQGFSRIVQDLLEAGAAVDVMKVKSRQGALWSAAYGGHNGVVELLVQNSAEFDAPDVTGTTPLFAAAQNNHSDVVETLMKAGADPNQVRPDQNSPLHTASFHCHPFVVTILVENSANKSLLNTIGYTALELTCLEKGQSPPPYEGIVGFDEGQIVNELAPLFASARHGDVPLTTELIKDGENVLDKLPNGWTVLHEAALGGDASVMNILISAGAGPNLSDQRNRTAVHISAKYGTIDVLESLGKHGANLNTRDIYGQTPFHVAASADQTTVISQLLDYGVPIDEADDQGQTALHLATASESIEVVRLLLDQGADQSILDADGLMPIQVVDKSNGTWSMSQRTIVDLYLERVPFLLVEASHKGDSALVRKWLGIGIDRKFLFFNGTSALHAAAAVGDLELVDDLLDHGVDIDLLNNNSQSVLHVAANLGKNKVLEALLDRGLNSQIVDNYGRTALHFAASSAQADLETVELVLAFGGDTDIQDEAGKTPLHLAVENDKLEAVRVLVRAGANVSIHDNNRKLPRDLVPTYLGLTRRQEFTDLLEVPGEMSSTEGNAAPPIDVENSVEVTQFSPDNGHSIEHFGATAKSGISKTLLFFVVLFPGLFLCALCGVATYIFKRSREEGIPSRWKKSNLLDTPSTIWTELYVPSDGSVRSSSLPLRSRQGHLSQAMSDPSEQDVMSPGIFKNPYYAEGRSSSRIEPICELEDAADTPQFRVRPVPFGSTEIWTAPTLAQQTNDSSPPSSSIPQRSCISFSDKDTSPRSAGPLEDDLKSKSERLIYVRPNTVPLPLHNMRVDIQRVRRRERNLTVYADAQSHFSSQSSKSFQSESAYFSAASAIGSHHLSQESFGSNLADIYGLQGLQIPEGQEIGGGARSSANLEPSASRSVNRLQDGTSSKGV